MATNVIKKINLPPHGFIKEIADIMKCSRHTVRRALYEGAKGAKAEKARQLYAAKYGINL